REPCDERAVLQDERIYGIVCEENTGGGMTSPFWYLPAEERILTGKEKCHEEAGNKACQINL
ncbi:MAG: hypothetical protein MR568_21160, partial [Eisenbergiella massiliensis]|uniref:hypothetical protein n=1 Tax=Eisenbergiella massiliensis TaxID=1720294 RepID=UPI0023F4B018